jgi:hypothetical protein
MSGIVRLTVKEGVMRGKEFVFDVHDTFLFGRMDECHACLPDDVRVSRHHFILEANPPDARIRDLGSLNGTYVNNTRYGGRKSHETPEEGAKRRYPQVDLRDGDEIKVGKTVLHVKVEVPTKFVGSIFCQHCERDVTAEVGPTRRGDYICEACRREARNDFATLLMASMQQSDQSDETNLNLPDYEIEKKIGEGGMGAVYLVHHKNRRERAALKVMLSKVAVDEIARKQFLREIEVTLKLRHENIVEVFDHGSSGSLFYFLMEYCEGGSLQSLIDRRGRPLSLAEAAPIMLQALDGLAHAHQNKIIHRDIKPQNILLKGSDLNWTVKIADMGLAKDFTQAGFSGMTATGDASGSLPYLPREQLTNFKYLNPASDVWSIGAAFYYMLTGHYPRSFPKGKDPLEAILYGEIIPVRQRDLSIPKRIAEVIDRSLADNISERYQSASEVRQVLEKAL